MILTIYIYYAWNMLYELVSIIENPELDDQEKIARLDAIHDEHPEYFDELHPQSNANILHYASLNSGIDLAAWLISHYPEAPGQITNAGNNILFTTVMHGNNELAHYYLHHYPSYLYAPYNKGCNHHGQTIVHAAVMGGDDETIELIHDELGTQEFRRLNCIIDNFGCTPLHYLTESDYETFNLCLHKGFPITTIDNDGNSLLHVAAKCDNLEFFTTLIARGFDINQCTAGENHLTPLMIATHRSSQQIVQYLIRHNANINDLDSYGNHAIHYAAMQEDVEIMQLLLDQGVEIDLPYFDGATPIMIAARKGLSKMFHFLLEAGASSKVKDKSDLNLAHYAASGGSLEILRTVRDIAVDLNHIAEQDANNTPLFYAALTGHSACYDYLIRHGANSDYWNRAGWHIVHAAAQGGNLEILQKLADDDIPFDLVQRNEAKNTPLFIAMSHYKYPAFERLLDASVSVDGVGGDGYSPLHLAVKLNNLFFLLLLLDHTERIDARTEDDYQDTPIMLAAMFGAESCFEALLSKGADVSIKNKNGWSCLHAACQSGNTHIIDYLIQEGLNINAKAEYDLLKTPLHIAAQYGHFNAVKYLIRAGAEFKCIDDLGWGVQHYAAASGNLSILAKLRALGTDFTQPTAQGETPESIAAENDHQEALQFIRDNLN